MFNRILSYTVEASSIFNVQYSIPSVLPRADPGVQALSPQLTVISRLHDTTVSNQQPLFVQTVC